jgi:serine/threonine protein kinase
LADIKPSNLFLCNNRFERIVLLDFGVAHYDQQIAHSVITQAGTVVGTLAYMSPEQARADKIITAAADIYSLGRVVYSGLVGKKRRDPEHMAAALAKVLFAEAAPLSQSCPSVPGPLSDLVGRMLAKPADEPESAYLNQASAFLRRPAEASFCMRPPKHGAVVRPKGRPWSNALRNRNVTETARARDDLPSLRAPSQTTAGSSTPRRDRGGGSP